MNLMLKTAALVVPSLIAGALLMGASGTRSASFDTITVKRINIVENDGTLRMVLSNKALFPGVIVKGKEHAQDRPFAGMLFFNDEGTENGGLIFNGSRDAEGKVSSGVSLTFDRYQQDQQLQLLGIDESGRHFAGMTINDVADGFARPIYSEVDEAAKKARTPAITKRMYVGKTPSGDAAIQLADANGKPRLALKVTPGGEAQIIFLDESGKPSRVLGAADLK